MPFQKPKQRAWFLTWRQHVPVFPVDVVVERVDLVQPLEHVQADSVDGEIGLVEEEVEVKQFAGAGGGAVEGGGYGFGLRWAWVAAW